MSTLNDSIPAAAGGGRGSGFKYYAIWNGRHANNCVFFSWEDASVHIEGYDRAIYQGFNNLMDASDFLIESAGNGNRNGQEAAKETTSSSSNNSFIPMTNHVNGTKNTSLSSQTASTSVNSASAVGELDLSSVSSNKRQRLETDKTNKKWGEMFAVLQTYHAAHGHCDVIKPKLKRQKTGVNGGTDSCSIDSDGNMDEMNPKLTQISIGNADIQPPKIGAVAADTNRNSKPMVDNDNALFNWVMIQRLEYRKLKKGVPNQLTAQRMQKLNDLGFNFSKRKEYLRWPDRLEQLRQYKLKHGHLNISVADVELGTFVARTRVEYAKYMDGNKKVGMNEERVRELTTLGFNFSAGKRRLRIKDKDGQLMVARKKTWNERFEELTKYKSEHGHCLVPQQAGLGEWVRKQRNNYKLLRAGNKSPMSAEMALKLTEEGFVFDASKHRKRTSSSTSRNETTLDEQDQHQRQPQHIPLHMPMDLNIDIDNNVLMEFQR